MRYNTKEWKEKRAEVIKEHCEWCGGNEILAIHHMKQLDVKQLKREIEEALYLQVHSKFPEIDVSSLPKADVCPNCQMGSIYFRKTMSPKYKCQRCLNEFDIPDKAVLVNTYKSAKWKLYSTTMRSFREEYKDELSKIFEEIWSRLNEEYISMSDTITLCKKCHYAIHHNLKLCSYCKKNYHHVKYTCCLDCCKNINPGEWKKRKEQTDFYLELEKIDEDDYDFL